jgi:uncharacterized protein YegP (UPF0339 family)
MLMPEQLYIAKDRQLAPAADYNFLRSEGLKYIEALAHGGWTDYNTHDPGITILEVLCYAITELAYRNNFDIKDLLADSKGDIGGQQPFFTPREILTNEPYTLLDYRKLLIDLKGVANAWLYPAVNSVKSTRPGLYGQTEVPLYPDCKNDRLTYAQTHHEPIDLRGLYHVRLDLDSTDAFGDLNSSSLDFTIYSNELRGARIECILPRYNEVDITWLETYYSEPPIQVSATPVEADAFGRLQRWTILLVYEKNADITTFQYDVQPSLRLPVANFEQLLQQELEQLVTQQQIMELFYYKTKLIRSIVQNAWETLHAHRNLCEDWWTVDTIRNTPIGICADVEIRPEIDIERVYAEIMVAIEQYLNPPVRFYSLKELREKDIAIEDIFEGPKLNNGFLLSNEVEAAELRAHIYVSDLINIIMDIDGVIAIKNILLTAYDDSGNAVLPSQKWCLHIDPDHKPVLDIERSKLVFFKQNLPYRVNAAEAMDTILYLRGAVQGHKIIGAEQDIALPTGRHYELGNYSSVQHDLPQTYGVGRAGLPETVSTERKAQAKQLKAYLLFYDQLLAGFFSQLQHARDLLGLDTDIRQSYFQQFLHDWKDDPENGIHNIQPIYANGSFLAQVLEAPIPGEPADITSARRQLIETDATLYERRNRFLDHLIARFAETFNDYVLTLYASKKAIDQQELIQDKIRFIKDYPRSSARRGTAYNILGTLWDTDNISGLENRLARLSGIDNPDRRSLFCYPMPEIVNEGTEASPQYTFVITDKDGNPYLKPVTPVAFFEQAERLLNEVYENMLVHTQYTIKNEAGEFHVFLSGSSGSIIATGVEAYTDQEGASGFINTVIKNMAPACDEEGMHLIEHFLLRPYFFPPALPPETPEEVYRLLQVCLPDDCLFCGEEDPYSFRVTIVLPYWPQRFRDSNFRRFFEMLARREAPAHVHVKVCWISFTDMYKLEAAYQEWLNALKSYRKDQQPDDARRELIRLASNKLIMILNGLTSVYPEATLHDCEESTTNPVRLGNTNLGSF